MSKMIYVRTDRNGTKIYHSYTCPRCGGTGYIDCYGHVEGGRCFKCNGTGELENPRTIKEYTPEYAEKLEARRRAREAKKAEQKNSKFYEKHGFSPEGKTYIVIGNTYEIKDELKEMGAKWDKFLNNTTGYGWRLPQDTDKYDTVEADVSEIYAANIYGVYQWDNWDGSPELYKRLEDAVEQKNKQENTSEYIGEIKQRLDLQVIYTGYARWNNPYSYYDDTFLYKFEDADGNQMIWKTSTEIDDLIEADENKSITIKATIKEHSEYNGIKQTVLTRCKLIA